jgi:hypothetical protein
METDQEAIHRFVRNTTGHFTGQYPLFLQRLRERGLDKPQIAAVIRTLGDTCTECWDNDKGCFCTRDE